MAAAAAISAEDASPACAAWGCPPERIRVLGDPRFDSVLERVGEVEPDRSPAPLRPGRAHDGGGLHLAAPMRRCSSGPSRESDRRHPDAASSSCHMSPPRSTWCHRAHGRSRGAAAAGAPERARRPVAASAGRPGGSPGCTVRRRHHGLCRRRLRAGRSSLGARAGGVGRPGRIRPPVAQQPRRGAAAREQGGAASLPHAGIRRSAAALETTVERMDYG